MKGVVIGLVLAVMMAAIAVAYQPPKYIGNPETGECKYYFAGDAEHFNPRPEGFTLDIAFTADFANESEACEFWHCVEKGNDWNIDDKRCVTRETDAARHNAIYIGNPDTGECQYFFTADITDNSSRPAGFTMNIGYVKDFTNITQACDAWLCVTTGGTYFKDGSCGCPEGKKFSAEDGCTDKLDQVPFITGQAVADVGDVPDQPGLFSRFFSWIKSLFS